MTNLASQAGGPQSVPNYPDWRATMNHAVTDPAELCRLLGLPPKAAVAGGDTIVYATKSGKKYHTAGCRSLSKSAIPISLSAAKTRGLQPCSVCKPPR